MFLEILQNSLVLESIFDKVAGLSPATLEHLWWLLLSQVDCYSERSCFLHIGRDLFLPYEITDQEIY